MPEGPEIWRAADKLNAALAGTKIQECFFYHDALKPYAGDIIGREVIRIEPRAKALITFFEDDLCIYTHNQLYGKWYTEPAGQRPNTSRSLRLVLENSENAALLYSASEIDVLTEEQLKDHSYLEKLGPDVVHPETTEEEIRAQFAADEFQNRKLSTLLLDQGFLSGVGNYLRSEILFYAKINPLIKLNDCSREQKDALAEAAQLLARRSYETKGITNDAKTVAALKREGVGRKGYRHFAYNRTGNFCYRCGTRIEETTTGGRKIYFCPSCQNVE